MRQAEAIKAGIKRLIAACDHALGRPAPAAIPREKDRSPLCSCSSRIVTAMLAPSHGAIQVRLIGSVAPAATPALTATSICSSSDGWLKPSTRESVYRDAIAL
jgi:hypothetical protein